MPEIDPEFLRTIAREAMQGVIREELFTPARPGQKMWWIEESPIPERPEEENGSRFKKIRGGRIPLIKPIVLKDANVFKEDSPSPKLNIFSISEPKVEAYNAFQEIVKDENGRIIEGQEVFETGVYHEGTDKEFHADESTLEKIVDNFRQLKDRIKVPLKLTHNHTGGACGWVSDLRKKGEKLIADFKYVPSKIHDLIVRKKAFVRPSVEIRPRLGEFKNVLTGVAFLGEELPEVDTLNDLLNLYHKQSDEKIQCLTEEEDFQVRLRTIEKQPLGLLGISFSESEKKELPDELFLKIKEEKRQRREESQQRLLNKLPSRRGD